MNMCQTIQDLAVASCSQLCSPLQVGKRTNNMVLEAPFVRFELLGVSIGFFLCSIRRDEAGC